MAEGTFRTFEDLEVYQAARVFRKSMYAVNKRLPDFERFELGSQIRRAAVSLTNNITEGRGHSHYPDQIKFSVQARGSLDGLVDDLNVCEDEHYLPPIEVGETERNRVASPPTSQRRHPLSARSKIRRTYDLTRTFFGRQDASIL